MQRAQITAGLALWFALAPAFAAPGLEELVVTARKREEPLLAVPVAVSVFDAQRIETLGLQSLDDIARFTPGFSLDSGTGRQPASYRPMIRGLTTIRNGIANASAATTFVDGVYVGGSVQPTELYNLERVEILRGPQSAQYGRASYAGAINYVTRRPAAEAEADLTLSAAEHETYEASGWLSGPLIAGRLAGAMAAGYREYGGEYRNERTGDEVGDERTADLTGKLVWQPADEVEVVAKAGYQRTDDGHYAIYLQPRTLNNCCFRSPTKPRAREYFIGYAESAERVNLFTDLLEAAGGAGTELERRLAALDVRIGLPASLELRSLTGLVDDELRRGFDASYAAYDPLAFVSPGLFTLVDRLDQRDFSQELRLASAAGGRLRWTTGLYYYRGELEERESRQVFLDAADEVATAPAAGPLTEDEIENLAVFGSLEVDIARRWAAGLELRLARDEITVSNRANDGTGALQERFEARFRSLTPRLTLSYRPAEDRTWYLGIARGTKPGDFNPQVPNDSYREVDEEDVWSYELGTKGLLGARARYALAVFYLDVDDQQLTTLVELDSGATASIVTNVGQTRTLGAELETGLTLTDTLSLEASYAWIDAEYREYISTEQADLRGSDGSFADNQRLGDVSGNELPRVPRHQASAALRYERGLGGLGLGYVVADWTFESSRYAQEHNLIETGNAARTGLRLGLDAGAWELTLWATNLLDDDTPVDVQRYFDTRDGFLPSYPQLGARPSSSPRAFAVSLPRGRQLGATLRWRF